MERAYGAFTRDLHFNPRLREGSDDRDYYIYRIRYDISIHASAREATRGALGTALGGGISIHASARGATIKLFLGGMSYRFQSTPPRGRRPCQVQTHPYNARISIHASAREATTLAAARLNFCCISIHASAREATLSVSVPVRQIQISIHASAREATKLLETKTQIWNISIHASVREATLA